MSLKTNLENLMTALGTDYKVIMGKLGTLSSLTTTAKTDLVSAINEVNAKPSGGAINDATTGTATTWSSSKIATEVSTAVNALVDGAPGALNTLNELAAAINDDASFSAAVTAALASRVRTDTAAQGLTGTEQTNARTNIAAAAASDLSTLTTNVGDTTFDLAAAYATAKA